MNGVLMRCELSLAMTSMAQRSRTLPPRKTKAEVDRGDRCCRCESTGIGAGGGIDAPQILPPPRPAAYACADEATKRTGVFVEIVRLRLPLKR